MSTKADTRNFSEKYQQIFLLDLIFFEQNIFTINEIKVFRTIARWYLLFFAKFLSHRV